MLRFREYVIEARQVEGIQHLEHPADLAFDGYNASKRALATLNGASNGFLSGHPMTRKIDDKLSFQVKKNGNKIGVKYKGYNGDYSYSHADLRKHYADKPHMVEHLGNVLSHVGKVLQHNGTYQGGLMSTDKTNRSETDTTISHKPNTVEYTTAKNTPEGKKLKDSKISITLHTRIHEDGSVTPVDNSEFASHPDVHVVPHSLQRGTVPNVGHQKRYKELLGQLKDDIETTKGKTNHLEGFSAHLRKYANKCVRTGETPSTDGFKQHIAGEYKRPEEKLAHIEANKQKFDNTFNIHNKLQIATNAIADGHDHNDQHNPGAWKSKIGELSAGEGYVYNGLKIVNRHVFSRANFAKRTQK